MTDPFWRNKILKLGKMHGLFGRLRKMGFNLVNYDSIWLRLDEERKNYFQ